MLVLKALRDFFSGIGRGFGLFISTRQDIPVYTAKLFNQPEHRYSK